MNRKLNAANNETRLVKLQAEHKHHPFHHVSNDIIAVIMGYKHDLEERSPAHFEVETAEYLVRFHHIRALCYQMEVHVEQLSYRYYPSTVRCLPDRIRRVKRSAYYYFGLTANRGWIDDDLKQRTRVLEERTNEFLDYISPVAERRQEWADAILKHVPLDLDGVGTNAWRNQVLENYPF